MLRYIVIFLVVAGSNFAYGQTLTNISFSHSFADVLPQAHRAYWGINSITAQNGVLLVAFDFTDAIWNITVPSVISAVQVSSSGEFQVLDNLTLPGEQCWSTLYTVTQDQFFLLCDPSMGHNNNSRSFKLYFFSVASTGQLKLYKTIVLPGKYGVIDVVQQGNSAVFWLHVETNAGAVSMWRLDASSMTLNMSASIFQNNATFEFGLDAVSPAGDIAIFAASNANNFETLLTAYNISTWQQLNHTNLNPSYQAYVTQTASLLLARKGNSATVVSFANFSTWQLALSNLTLANQLAYNLGYFMASLGSYVFIQTVNSGPGGYGMVSQIRVSGIHLELAAQVDIPADTHVPIVVDSNYLYTAYGGGGLVFKTIIAYKMQ